jgi:hypothetical protein
MNRELTENEISWLKRGLKTLATGEYDANGRIQLRSGHVIGTALSRNPSFYLAQLKGLRVVEESIIEEEGVHWLRFQHCGNGTSDCMVTYHTEDGRYLLIMVDRRSLMISELEIV